MASNPVTVLTGEVSGSVAAKQLPNTGNVSVACIKAVISNVGNVYVGGATVTKPDGTTDTTTGLELVAGDVLWITAPLNLNQLYIICDNAGDDIVYLVQQ